MYILFDMQTVLMYSYEKKNSGAITEQKTQPALIRLNVSTVLAPEK